MDFGIPCESSDFFDDPFNTWQNAPLLSTTRSSGFVELNRYYFLPPFAQPSTPKMPSLNGKQKMDSLACGKCKYKFSQKSSLIRHSKRCMQHRPQNVRQKSCRECSAAKTRCDLRRPSCSRCSLRQTSCHYAAFQQVTRSEDGSDTSDSLQSRAHSEDVASTRGLNVEPIRSRQHSELPVTDIHSFNTAAQDALNSELSTLFHPSRGAFEGSLNASLNNFDSHEINGNNNQLRFMGSSQGQTGFKYLFPTGPATPYLVHHSMEYILRVLRTWPRMMAKGLQLPPLIHPAQGATNKSKWLSNCFTLVKMWHGQCHGTSSIVQATVKKEMQDIINTYQTLDETNILAALQSLSIYLLILLFPSNDQIALPLLDEGMFLQIRNIVYHVATSGLVLQEETDHVRPSWESWIHVSSKRRAVLTLYLIQWSYSVHHGLPSYDCRDLGFMPAPSAKYLWQASDKKQWEILYNRWLAQWDGSDYYQWEFFEVQPGVRMGDRAELWLEDADEFGMIFVSILNASEREPEFEIIHL